MRMTRVRAERGMSTAEYSVGTLGAVSIAALLLADNPIREIAGSVFAEAARLIVDLEVSQLGQIPRVVIEAVQNAWPW